MAAWARNGCPTDVRVQRQLTFCLCYQRAWLGRAHGRGRPCCASVRRVAQVCSGAAACSRLALELATSVSAIAMSAQLYCGMCTGLVTRCMNDASMFVSVCMCGAEGYRSVYMHTLHRVLEQTRHSAVFCSTGSTVWSPICDTRPSR